MSQYSSIGIDIGGTNLRVALVSGEGAVLKRLQFSSAGDIVGTITSAVDGLLGERPAAIGIASAGLIDRKEGIVTISPNLPAVTGIRFKDILGGKFGLPVAIENDANLAAFGERYVGAGKDFSSFVLMTLGTGIGGGIMHGDRLLDIPAEIGHMVVEPEGRQCSCGNRGCLEEYAAAKAMIAMATSALEKGQASVLRNCCEGNIYRITPRTIYDGAMDGDMLSRDILRTAGRYLGIGMATLANIFNPDAFILAGGLTNAWDLYVEDAVREAEKRALKGLFTRAMVVRSSITEDAGIIGAALYALKSANR